MKSKAFNAVETVTTNHIGDTNNNNSTSNYYL